MNVTMTRRASAFARLLMGRVEIDKRPEASQENICGFSLRAILGQKKVFKIYCPVKGGGTETDRSVVEEVENL
jgi:hypothetical protein